MDVGLARRRINHIGDVAVDVSDSSSVVNIAPGLRMKTSGATLPRIRDRHVLMAFIGGLAVAICGGGFAFRPGSPGFAALLQDRSGIDAGELLAIAVLVSLVLRFRDEELLSPCELLVIASTSLAFALPFRQAAIAPLTIVGALFVLRREPRLFSIGQLLLALVFYEWVGQILFDILSPFALRAEALAVQALLSLFGNFTLNDLVITGNDGHGIYIETACSAFHNLSLATLIWISLVKLDTLIMKSFHWWILAAMAGATVALNTARLALMAQSYSMYDFWHHGPGAAIVSFTMLAAILGIFLGGRSFAAPH